MPANPPPLGYVTPTVGLGRTTVDTAASSGTHVAVARSKRWMPIVPPVTVVGLAASRFWMPTTPGTSMTAPVLVAVTALVRSWPGRTSPGVWVTPTDSAGTSDGSAVVRAGRAQSAAVTRVADPVILTVSPINPQKNWCPDPEIWISPPSAWR